MQRLIPLCSSLDPKLKVHLSRDMVYLDYSIHVIYKEDAFHQMKSKKLG